MICYNVAPEAEGMKLLTFISRKLPEAPEALIYRLIRQKKIKVNRKRTEAGYRLSAGDTVQIWLEDSRIKGLEGHADVSGASDHVDDVRVFQRLKESVSVIYEDQDIIVLNKPAGVLSQGAKAGDESLNGFLTGLLVFRGEITPESLRTVRPSVMSRLDRNTTGLVLCGKTVRGEQYLSKALKDRSMEKYYLAAVHGITPESGREEAYLLKDERNNLVRVSRNPFEGGGYRIITGYERLSEDRDRDISLLRVELVTGRPHQIRAHMAFLGYPVIGDPKYGDRRRDRELLQGDKKLFLHSWKEMLPDGREFSSPVPAHFRRLFPGSDI